jgi:hypothetical protein
VATGRIGVTPNLGIRWSKVPTGGTTSLSGNDDNSVPLAYSAGYEAVYRNGVLLSRGNDYTATNGTSITLVDATITGDLIEVFANQTVALTDTYSQSAANAKFINNTLTTTTGDIIYASAANTPARLGIGSSNQVLTVSGGVPAWATASSGAFVLINRTTFSNVASQTVDNIFTSTYTNYVVVLENIWNHTSRNNDLAFQLVYSGTAATTGYYGNARGWNENATIGGINSSGSGQMNLAPDMGGDADEGYNGYLVFTDVATGGNKKAKWHGHGAQYADFTGSVGLSLLTWGSNETARAYTGLKLLASAGNISGKITTYGLANS